MFMYLFLFWGDIGIARRVHVHSQGREKLLGVIYRGKL